MSRLPASRLTALLSALSSRSTPRERIAPTMRREGPPGRGGPSFTGKPKGRSERDDDHRRQRESPRFVERTVRKPRRSSFPDLRGSGRASSLVHLRRVRPLGEPHGELPAVGRGEKRRQRGHPAVQLARVRVGHLRLGEDRGSGGAHQHAARLRRVRLPVRPLRHPHGHLRAGLPRLLFRRGRAPVSEQHLRGTTRLPHGARARLPQRRRGTRRGRRRLRRRRERMRRCAGRSVRAGRPGHGDDHLHFRHHLVPQGRGDHPCEHALRRLLRRLAMRLRAR